MPDKPSEDRFKDIPALANPTTPSLRRLRARLEGRTPAQTRKTKPKDSTAEPSEVPQSTEVKSDPMAANTTPVQDLPDEPAQVETKPFKLRLTKPHSLITQTQELEQRQRRGEWAYLSRDPWPGVASGVSKGQKRIALAVMDRLFKVLETEGMRVELCDGPRRRGAHAVDGRDKTPLEITEEHRETPHVPTEQELKKKERDPYYRIPKKDVLPTGQLILAPGGRVDLSSEAALEAVLAKAVAEVKESLAEARTSREAAEQRRDEEWRPSQDRAHNDSEPGLADGGGRIFLYGLQSEALWAARTMVRLRCAHLLGLCPIDRGQSYYLIRSDNGMSGNSIQLFTIGFAGKSAEQFFTILGNAGVQRVVDVRLYNSSQLAGYTKRGDLPYFLKSILGAGYVHLPIFAPTKQLLNGYKKGEYSWSAYEQAYQAILDQREPHAHVNPALLDRGCLLCAEPTADQCHRRLAAEYFQHHWPNMTIHHL